MLGSYCSTTVWKCTRAIRYIPSILLYTTALAVILSVGSFAAEVVTDSTAYNVGSTVGIDGFTFGSSETVTLQITEPDGTPIVGEAGLPWDVTSDGAGDFGTSWLLDYQGTSSELVITAVGQTSGLIATTSFVTGATNLDQLQNGTGTTPPEWSNGNINSSNSCYSEGTAVPYRAFIDAALGADSTHFFTIEMEWTKGGIHAFDFLASYDFSEDSAINLAGGPCGSVGTSAPGDCVDPADSLELPDPTLTSNYSGPIPGDFYPGSYVYNGTHYLMAYNVDSIWIDSYQFGGTSSDRTWSVVVHYKQSAAGTVGFYWGGNLAQGDPDHWDYGNGSASVSGAPYHMRMKSFDGGGGAGQDRSIQNGTICLPPAAMILIDTDTLCYDTDTTYTAYDTSDANDWLWRVTGGTIIGDSTLSSVEFSVDGAGDVTIELVACNTNGGCPGDFCCADVSLTLPTKSCNHPPEVTCPPIDTLFVCDLSEICVSAFTSYDADGDPLTCVASPGNLDGDSVCFTPVEGDNIITYICTDPHGAADTCETTIHVLLNQPPNDPSCPPGDTLIVCDLSEICIDGFVGNGDPDGNLDSCYVTGGALSGGAVCFTPVEGANSITYTCVDSCGETSSCQTVITVIVDDEGPTVTCPADTSLVVCDLSDICIDGFSSVDADSCWVTPGTLTDGAVCFTPVEGVNTITYTCVDSCGNESSCQTIVSVTLDTVGPDVWCPPDDTVLVCELGELCIDGFGSSGSVNCWVNQGTLTDGTVCFEAAEGPNTITFTCADSCGNQSSCSTTVYVTLNSAPECDCGRPTYDTLFVCDLSEICLGGFEECYDPDDNLDYCYAVGGTLTGDTICFDPVEGVNTILYICVDSCGLADTCEINIHIDLNSPPVVACPPDDTLLVCDLSDICISGFVGYDPDDNLAYCYATPGTLEGDSVCFTPAVGANTITYICIDSCGGADTCQTTIWVDINSAPVVSCPPSDTVFFCELPQNYCAGPFDSYDSDGNLLYCDVSNGTLIGDSVCFQPVAGPNTITYWCLDACGLADTCQTTVVVELNHAPVANCAADVDTFLCDRQEICIPGFSCSDVDGNLKNCETSRGTLNGNQVCFTPPGEGTWDIILTATDSCDEVDACTTWVTVDINDSPAVTCPPDSTIETCFPDDTVCVTGFSATDPNGNLKTTLLNGMPYDPSQPYCFVPDSGANPLVFTAIDSCYDTTVCTTTITIIELSEEECAQCPIVKIEKTHDSYQGQHEFVEVTIDSAQLLPKGGMGGYDFLIAWDASALVLQSVVPGPAFYDQAPDGCGWEYFVYRFGPCGHCADNCPTGMVRVFGLAETNNGPNHPDCFSPEDEPATVFTLDYLITNDRTFECQYVPIYFFWCDCGDNTISDATGNRLYLDEIIYDFEGGIIWDENDDDNYPEDARIPWVGAPDYCIDPEPGKPTPIRCIDFWNGGIDIVCADSIDDRGDINLNGTVNEIADAVLFSNYFVKGILVFNVNIDGQIAASDVNADGITLSVADLVYLIRIIVGDALPYPKLTPVEVDADLGDGVLSADGEMGAAHVVVENSITPVLLAESMEMKYHYDAEQNLTRILVYSMEPGARFSGDFLGGIEGNVITLEMATYDGAPVTTKLVPEEFALYPCYPNPFNPITTISFALASSVDYELVIYNALGQRVETFTGHGGPGLERVDWNATGYSSGVYFYRLTAGDFTDTRKMVLLK